MILLQKSIFIESIMALEIERKFLVCGEFMDDAINSSDIIQGYLSHDPDRTVRVRIRDDRGFVTVKGKSGESGMDRYEWEKEIPVDDARELLRLCDHSPVMKTRFIVPFRGHNFEVDVFHGENEGLIMAELELCSVNEEFAKPEWLGEEVTSDPRYYNSSLAVKPFSRW